MLIYYILTILDFQVKDIYFNLQYNVLSKVIALPRVL